MYGGLNCHRRAWQKRKRYSHEMTTEESVLKVAHPMCVFLFPPQNCDKPLPKFKHPPMMSPCCTESTWWRTERRAKAKVALEGSVQQAASPQRVETISAIKQGNNQTHLNFVRNNLLVQNTRDEIYRPNLRCCTRICFCTRWTSAR